MKEYKLTSYARLTSSPSGEAWDDCETTASSSAALKLSLLEVGFLVISAGSRELEALCIATGQHDFRAVFRDKHVLFLQRIGDKFRRFRVKFAHRVDAAECVHDISNKFHVQGSECLEPAGKSSASASAGDAGKVVVLRGDVTVSGLAAALLDPQSSQLPSAYYAPVAHLSSEEMEEAILLHLMDATFPSFVETVEQLIRQMAAF